MAMSDAQLMHAERKWPDGEEAYQGKLLEATSKRLEGRIRVNSVGAHNGARLGSLQ